MKKNSKTRILIVDNTLAFTGAFKSVFEMTKHLGGKYHFIFCLPSRSTLKSALPLPNIEVVTLPFLEISKSLSVLLYIPVLLVNAIRLAYITRVHHIDIVHVNDLYNMTGILVKILRPRLKLIYHVRLMPGSYARALYPLWIKLILRFADNIVCVSYAVRKGIASDAAKIQVIYDTLPMQENLPLAPQAGVANIRLLYLANFIPGKGQDFAISAMKEVVKELPDVKMVMCGGNLGKKSNVAYKKAMMEKAEALQLRSHIIFRDFEPDVEKLMKEATLFLNFSESESFSMTCLEALFYGTPLIATDCGGPSELFENGRSGLLVRNRDITAMKNAVLTLCRDAALRKQFSENGRRFVREKFNVEQMINQYKQLYEIHNADV